LITPLQFKKALQKDELAYLAILKEVNDIPAETADPHSKQQSKVQKEYADILQTTLPQELPPPQTVDHTIEVIPGQSPPSKAPYHLAPVELTELK